MCFISVASLFMQNVELVALSLPTALGHGSQVEITGVEGAGLRLGVHSTQSESSMRRRATLQGDEHGERVAVGELDVMLGLLLPIEDGHRGGGGYLTHRGLHEPLAGTQPLDRVPVSNHQAIQPVPPQRRCTLRGDPRSRFVRP